MDVNPELRRSRGPEHDSAQPTDMAALAALPPQIGPRKVFLAPIRFHRGWKSVFSSLRVRECRA